MRSVDVACERVHQPHQPDAMARNQRTRFSLVEGLPSHLCRQSEDIGIGVLMTTASVAPLCRNRRLEECRPAGDTNVYKTYAL